MKRLKHIFIVAFVIITYDKSSAQGYMPGDTVTLVANFYTGQTTQLTGSYSKKTEQGEQGSLKVSNSGNIQVVINPSDLSIGGNETKTWNGFIVPDNISIPLPGTSESGWLKGEYDITYMKPNPEDPFNGNTAVTAKGSELLNFIIYSINIDFNCSEDLFILPGQKIEVKGAGYPSGGNYNWVVETPGINITGSTNEPAIMIESEGGGTDAILSLTYEIKGINITRKIHVHLPQPSVPETVMIDSGVTEIDIFKNDNHYILTFTPSGTGFFIRPTGTDAFLISSSPQIMNLNDDPFSVENLYYRANKSLMYLYPDLNALLAGQAEDSENPETDPTLQNPEDVNENQTPLVVNYMKDPSVNSEKLFIRPINVVLRSNPSVVIGQIIIKVEN